MAQTVTFQGSPRFINHMTGTILKAYPVADNMINSLSEQVPHRGDLLEDRQTSKWYGVKDTITFFRRWNERRKPKCQIVVVSITRPTSLPKPTPRRVVSSPYHHQTPNNWPTIEEIDALLF